MASQNTVAIATATLALGTSLGVALSLPLARSAPSACTHQPSPTVILRTVEGQPVAVQPPLQVESAAEPRPANAGEPVSPGTTVLAKWTDGSWWEGVVTQKAQDLVTVAWADGSTPSRLPHTDVALLAKTIPITSVALCSWQSSTRWWAARIAEGAGLIHYLDGGSAPLFEESCVAAVAGY